MNSTSDPPVAATKGPGFQKSSVVRIYLLDLEAAATEFLLMRVRIRKGFKEGKEHRYSSVVENFRIRGGGVVQRQVLYLGMVKDSQRAAWCRAIEFFEGKSRSRQVALNSVQI